MGSEGVVDLRSKYVESNTSTRIQCGETSIDSVQKTFESNSLWVLAKDVTGLPG